MIGWGHLTNQQEGCMEGAQRGVFRGFQRVCGGVHAGVHRGGCPQQPFILVGDNRAFEV